MFAMIKQCQAQIDHMLIRAIPMDHFKIYQIFVCNKINSYMLDTKNPKNTRHNGLFFNGNLRKIIALAGRTYDNHNSPPP